LIPDGPLVDKLASVGLRARAAVADTWGAAHALARFSAQPGYISELGKAAADVSRLPIIALRLAPDLVDALRVLGFDRVADLLAQPRAPLALRFGPELGRRLDQAIGRSAEPIEPIRPEALIEVRRAFAEPIGVAETIVRYIGNLAAQLCDVTWCARFGVWLAHCRSNLCAPLKLRHAICRVRPKLRG
jgi:protein ImuB